MSLMFDHAKVPFQCVKNVRETAQGLGLEYGAFDSWLSIHGSIK